MGRPPLPIGEHGTVTCRALDDGRWRAVTNYRDADGVTRRVERVADTERRARRALTDALSHRGGPTHGSLTRDSRFREAADVWLGLLEPRRAGTTVDRYRSWLDAYALPAVGELRLHEITVERVDTLFAALERRGLSVATRRNARKVLAGPLAVAVRYGALPANPVRDAMPIEGRRGKQPRALTAAERVQLLAKLDSDEAARDADVPDLVRFMLGTGVRIGEALAVTWADVTAPAAGQPGRVHVTGNIVRERARGLVRHDGKTAAALRTLTLPAATSDVLYRRQFPSGPGGDPWRPVFPGSDGGWRDPAAASRAMRAACDRAGFGWVTSHVFRKTVATMLDEQGKSARVVADQLGHARPSITMDVYMARGQTGDEAAAALDDAAADERAAR